MSTFLEYILELSESNGCLFPCLRVPTSKSLAARLAQKRNQVHMVFGECYWSCIAFDCLKRFVNKLLTFIDNINTNYTFFVFLIINV